MTSELQPDSNNPTPITDPNDQLRRKYGAGFPKIEDWEDGKQWRLWVEGERKTQEPIMRDKRLHWSRHRHFRFGHQWISSRDGRLWREPQADVNDVRPVLNMVGPALDFRLGLIMEQKPGFRTEPIGSGTAERESAEAQQSVSEYYFYLLRAWNVFMDALFNAQTDGVSFVHIYIDPQAGPTKEDVEIVPSTDERYAGLVAQGYQQEGDGVLLPYLDEGVQGPPDAQARTLTGGDLACRIIMAHEVIFNPEARSINGPVDKAKWCVIRRMRSVQDARLETGLAEIDSEMTITSQSDVLDMPIDRSMGWQRGLPPFPTRRQRVQDGVPEYLIFITPDIATQGLEQGRWLRVVGNVIVESGEELPGGVIPLARFTDGSPDNDIFPRPTMSDWIGDQIIINALAGTLLKHARFFGGGRMLTVKNTLLEESYSNIVGSVVEYQGQKPDMLQPTAAGQDLWELLSFFVKKLEDKMMYNDAARGNPSGDSSMQDVSGRAVLASQQLYERAFGPAVRAASEGATEWAHIVVKYAQWLFDEPRLIPMVGGRGDLAKMISGDDLGKRVMVYVDPETMMPIPRTLRQQIIEDQFSKGLITIETYRQRSPYADIRNINAGGVEQWARAQWINTLLEENWEQLGQMAQVDPMAAFDPKNSMAVLWQDDPAIHKAALNEIVLNERKPWIMRQFAFDRWGVYDQMERAKLDQTGMTQIPYEVLGIPKDRVAAQAPMVAQAMPAPTGGPSGPQTLPAVGTSAAPSNSGVPVAAANLPKPQLSPNDQQMLDAQQG